MKVLADRDQLLAALGAVSPAVPLRSPKPIIQNVKLHAPGDGTAVLMGTDLEVAIRRDVLGVEVDTPGAAILPPGRLGQILRSVKDATVSIEVKKSAVVVKGARSEFKLQAEDPSLYPDPPTWEPSGHWRILADDLKAAIRRTIFATDPDSTKYALAGVMFEPGEDGESARLVATDGRRMSVQEFAAEVVGSVAAEKSPPVVPTKAWKLIERSLDGADDACLALARDSAVMVQAGRSVIWCRLVEGRFPPYRAILPKSHNHRIEFPTAGDLLDAVEGARVTTSKESRAIDLYFGSGKLTLSAKAADVGESSVELPVETDGTGFPVAMDGVYLAEMLRAVEPDSPISVDIVDAKTAVVFAALGYTYAISPMNQNG